MYKKNGYSLIELIVSLYIVAIISSLFVFNYQRGDSQTVMNISTQLLASNIRSAQSYALAQNALGGISTSSWGINFNLGTPNSYIVYSDLNTNLQYDVGEIYSRIFLPEDIEIEGMTLDNNATNPLDIVFRAPYPDTFFNQSSTTNDIAEVTLKQYGHGTTSVEVNAYGLINASESFEIKILLNSATGDDCDTVCLNAGFSGCISVGTDEFASNAMRWRQTGPNCNEQAGPFNCGHTMNAATKICDGYLADWVFCNCD